MQLLDTKSQSRVQLERFSEGGKSGDSCNVSQCAYEQWQLHISLNAKEASRLIYESSFELSCFFLMLLDRF